MITHKFNKATRILSFALLSLLLTGIVSQPVFGQSEGQSDSGLKKLRSDVGIHGLTANIHSLGDLTYKENNPLITDGSSELEFVYRDVRMMSQRLGVGFQILTSFFVDSPNNSFGVGSWGVGPLVRVYPFRTNRLQPYTQMNLMFGNNMGLNTLANTQGAAENFRVRFGLRAGLAYRMSNTIGLFTEIGYDWESDRLFRADSRALQANIGIDFYLFN
ncbi:hypothetical protein LX73_1082 [Fodinibius salinus]|uniref:Outer membrane protein beta-barrel domain-containing protein n=1 Tax=Fodinibius salinus TaxID=860790 RepID=A0A5D3YIW5_9BACT|nr:hypothetical protein [Fodinibius salinus]TYP93380.1 hypothetical protein LX73_1082 [Fodinibius salinus]